MGDLRSKIIATGLPDSWATKIEKVMIQLYNIGIDADELPAIISQYQKIDVAKLRENVCKLYGKK